MVLPFYKAKVPDCGPSTVFLSEVVFDNNTFVGPASRSKKEAEQNAAHVVIVSLLGKYLTISF
jgi:dsRNA-specific ribonuclease